MERIAFRMLFLYYFLLLHGANSVEEDIKLSLIRFLEKLSPSNGIIMDPNFGWNMSSDPCAGQWKGVTCDTRSISVKKIVLDNFSLNGTLDAESLCSVQSIILLSLNNNNISGEIPREIADCKELTHFYVSGNRFVGSVPALLFSNLKRLDISNNIFLGELPALPAISSLVSFRAEYNQLSGAVPAFNFPNLQAFNVSFNKFSGRIPDVKGCFAADSFIGNPGLCGIPLPNSCAPSPSPTKK